MKVKLKDVCERASSALMQKDVKLGNGDFPVYGAAGYIGNINFYHQENPYVAVVKDGAGIGRTMLLPAKSSVIGTLQYLLPKANVLPEYLNYAVQYMRLEKYYTGATIPHIYFRNYQNEEFNMGTLEEQSRIVDILDNVMQIIDTRKKQLLELDHIVKSRFIEMFGDPVINAKGWNIHQLSDYIDFLTSGSRGWAKYFTDEGEYFITIKNVKDCRITLDNIQHVNAPNNAEAKRTKVKEGDLLISITADLGRTGVVTTEIASYGAYINQHLTCIRLRREELNPLYVAYFMESEAGKRQFQSKNQSGVKAGVNFDAINTLNLMVPPIAMQRDFVLFVHQADKSKLAIQKSLEKLEILQKSLMQQYFG